MWRNSSNCLKTPPDLIYDEACLDVYNLLNDTVEVLGQYDECDRCDLMSVVNLTSSSNQSLLINTQFSVRMHYRLKGSMLCEWNRNLLEHYRYGWNISQKCETPYIQSEADNPYIPILSAFIILFFFGTIWYMVKCVYKCTKQNRLWSYIFRNSTDISNDLGETPLVIERPPASPMRTRRIKSLDVFRGLCIMLMIFVNYGGGKYWFFQHSVWNGLTVADLVFPWFLWLMGLSLFVSIHEKVRDANAFRRRQLMLHVLRRSILLFLIGIVINSHSHGSGNSLSTLRILGVMQRIALTYLIVGFFESCLAKYVTEVSSTAMSEVTSAWKQWIFCILLITLHSVFTFGVDIPGCPKGYVGPGGYEDGGKHFNCTGGVAGYLDRYVLGQHIYQGGQYMKVYQTNLRVDPEGILGILTATFIVFMGVHAGRILKYYNNTKQCIIRWIIYGVMFGLLGGVLCGYTKNGGPIPINKHLWSLSFVLILSGMAYLIFAFLYLVVDVTRKWGGRPFFYPGMNPLLLYILHDIFKNTFPVGWKPYHETHAAYLGMNLWGTAFWVCFSIFLYKKFIFISI